VEYYRSFRPGSLAIFAAPGLETAGASQDTLNTTSPSVLVRTVQPFISTAMHARRPALDVRAASEENPTDRGVMAQPTRNVRVHASTSKFYSSDYAARGATAEAECPSHPDVIALSNGAERPKAQANGNYCRSTLRASAHRNNSSSNTTAAFF
jgi:hypothetical protein